MAKTLWSLAAAIGMAVAPATLLAQATSAAPATTRARAATTVPADQPAPRGGAATPDPRWMGRHDSYVALAKKGGIDLYFLGDSITDGWHAKGKAIWDKEFAGWKPGNFGIGGDTTQHVLWRLQNGEFEGVKPKVLVLMIGTNNGRNTVTEVAAGVTAIVREIQKQSPQTKILLLGIFPRSAKAADPVRQKIKDVNAILAKLDDGKMLKYLDFGEKFLDADGALPKDIMPDFLHPNEKGYAIWAEAIKPVLTEWLGAPATVKPAGN